MLTKILASGLADGAATAAVVAAGAVVQVAQTTNVTSGATLASGMPYLTVPVITNGTEFLSLSLTPKSVSNKVLVIAELVGSAGTADVVSLSVWRGSTYVTGSSSGVYANWATPVIAVLLDSPATVSPVTYTVRGGGATYAVYLNGSSSARWASAISSLTLLEVKA